MEVGSVICELSSTSHRAYMMDGGESDVSKCGKRRQRDSSLAILEANEQPQEQQPQGNQSTTTVKRSSRFRGVSRRSSGFSRGVSRYRGVARPHLVGPYARGHPLKELLSTQEEAARAYDIAAIEYRGINAVTNFTLSTYIRWLRPEAPSSLLVGKPSTDLQNMTTSNLVQTEGTTEVSNFILHPFPAGDPESTKKQGISQYMSSLSACNNKKSSSPTALGILTKSSVFSELMKKNLNSASEESEESELKIPQEGSDGGFEVAFDHEIASNNSFLCPSNNNSRFCMESPEESTWP